MLLCETYFCRIILKFITLRKLILTHYKFYFYEHTTVCEPPHQP